MTKDKQERLLLLLLFVLLFLQQETTHALIDPISEKGEVGLQICEVCLMWFFRLPKVREFLDRKKMYQSLIRSKQLIRLNLSLGLLW